MGICTGETGCIEKKMKPLKPNADNESHKVLKAKIEKIMNDLYEKMEKERK